MTGLPRKLLRLICLPTGVERVKSGAIAPTWMLEDRAEVDWGVFGRNKPAAMMARVPATASIIITRVATVATFVPKMVGETWQGQDLVPWDGLASRHIRVMVVAPLAGAMRDGIPVSFASKVVAMFLCAEESP